MKMIFPCVPLNSIAVISLRNIDTENIAKGANFIDLIRSNPSMVLFCGEKAAEFWHDCFDEELLCWRANQGAQKERSENSILTTWECRYVDKHCDAIRLVQKYYPDKKLEIAILSFSQHTSNIQQERSYAG